MIEGQQKIRRDRFDLIWEQYRKDNRYGGILSKENADLLYSATPFLIERDCEIESKGAIETEGPLQFLDPYLERRRKNLSDYVRNKKPLPRLWTDLPGELSSLLDNHPQTDRFLPGTTMDNRMPYAGHRFNLERRPN